MKRTLGTSALVVNLIATLVAAALVGAPTLAFAQEDNLEQIEMARMQYEEGTQQYKAGKFAEAGKSFRQVYDAIHTTSVLFDIGLAEEKQRHWADAADSFDRFMRGSQRVNNRKRLEQRVVTLRQRAVRQAELANMANPKVRPQGKPGAPGNEMMESSKDEELALGSGEQAQPETLTPVPSGATPPAAVEPTDGRKSRTWVWVVAGVAVAVAAGVGIGLAVGLHKNEASPVDLSIGPAFSQGLVEF